MDDAYPLEGMDLPGLLSCRDPDVLDAIEAYVTADKARERARQALERADRVAGQREAELRAAYERVAGQEAPRG